MTMYGSYKSFGWTINKKDNNKLKTHEHSNKILQLYLPVYLVWEEEWQEIVNQLAQQSPPAIHLQELKSVRLELVSN